MTNNSPAFIEWHVTSWQEAVDLARLMHGWIYRGQESLEWGLTSSLERIAKAYNCPGITLKEQEEEILNKFKRQAHQYLTHLPKDNDNLEWLSLIQHHGGPTRLLDFTLSFYAGVFFAVENAINEAVLWAVNRHLLDKPLISLVETRKKIGHSINIREASVFCVEHSISPTLDLLGYGTKDKGILFEHLRTVTGKPNIVPVKPWRLNQRMIIQQGWFLFPTSLDVTFEHNLCNAFGIPDQTLPSKTPARTIDELKRLVKEPDSNLALLKIMLSKDVHLEAMRDLQQMNITAATLFPGLDGFARSLKFPLRIFDDLERIEDETIS